MDDPGRLVILRPLARAVLAGGSGWGLLALSGSVRAGQSNLEQTMPLVWVLTGASVVGAALTYAFLTYALWKFRDPKTRGRRYG